MFRRCFSGAAAAAKFNKPLLPHWAPSSNLSFSDLQNKEFIHAYKTDLAKTFFTNYIRSTCPYTLVDSIKTKLLHKPNTEVIEIETIDEATFKDKAAIESLWSFIQSLPSEKLKVPGFCSLDNRFFAHGNFEAICKSHPKISLLYRLKKTTPTKPSTLEIYIAGALTTCGVGIFLIFTICI